MINSYTPTLRKPNENSSEWYRRFHNTFYISQLVNNTLLTYMDSFIEIVSLEGIIKENFDELERIGAIHKINKKNTISINREKIYPLDVEQGLNELILKFKRAAKEHRHIFMCMGVDFGDYMDRDIDINLDELKNSTHSSDWYQIVKGFLNVWEFLFIFSNAESTFKSIISDNNYNTSDLIGKILKQNKLLANEMNNKHNMNKKFMLTLWDLFCYIRNIYSHTHGVISTENRQTLIKKSSAFKIEFESAFHKDMVLSSLIIKTDEIFQYHNTPTEKFYLISA